jgi:hypothetical protein
MSQNPSSSPVATPEPADPVVEAEVQRATAAYRALLPADAFAEMQALVGDVLATHPVATVLVARTRERAPVERSGDQPRDGVTPAALPGRARGGGER